jgi:hypothetical protein
VSVTDVELVVMIGVVVVTGGVVVVTGGVVVVTVSVEVVGGALEVGNPLPGSDGPPPEAPPPAALSALVSDDPACPLPDPQLAAAKPTTDSATARTTHSARSNVSPYAVPVASCHRTISA